jgi:DNA-binding transcriptional ArsR family regulator
MVKLRSLDRTFSALSDPTRRDILQRLTRGPATVSELGRPYGLSLPGVIKHVRILEEARLLTTEKTGRVRECQLAGPSGLDDVTEWIDVYRRNWQRRLDRLDRYVKRTRAAAK